jgi:quercetin dioxygenase-like cupin family protein
MTEPAIRPAFHQHKEDEHMLKARESRPGEPELEGDRWWPHETWKYADLADEGVLLTSYQQWLAERERTRRKNRATMPSVVRREDLRFEPTRAPGVYVAYVVAPHMNQEAPSHTVEILHLRPGAKTLPLRENESVYHVLSGRGYSTIYDEKIEWSLHDSFHVPEGAWYQIVNDSPDPVNLMVARVTPLMEQVYTMAIVYKGDSFSDLADDYKPEHPFTKERVSVEYVDGMKWMSEMQASHHKSRGSQVEASRESRKLMKAADAVIQRSHHKGDWKVGLIDNFFGFTNKILGIVVHQMPPACHTETHKHGWATVYVLSGSGYSIVDGDRYDWRVGDMINVPAGAWHQHFNTDPDQVSQHLVLGPGPLRERIHLTLGSVEERTEEMPEFADDGYVPAGAWWDQPAPDR